MIHLELQPEIEAQLTAEAQARGIPVERFVEELVITHLPEPELPPTAARAAATLRELRKYVRLEGLSIPDLIHQGRRF